jgi:hypothetical protein
VSGGQAQDRTADLRFFRAALYRLSYLTRIINLPSVQWAKQDSNL